MDMTTNPELPVFEFDAVIEAARGGGAFVRFPYEVSAVFGTKGHVPVTATFDGEPYRGSLANMGNGCHVLGILKAIRTKLGKQPGDVVHVRLQQDLEERIIEIPKELQLLLHQNTEAQVFFESLAFTHRREYCTYISEAKRPETRVKRAEKTVELLRDRKKGK